MNINENTGRGPGERPVAVQHAETGAAAWRTVARAQRVAAPDHADFYAVAGELVETLHALQDVASVLRRQVAGYGEGRRVYDDSATVDPALRLATAADRLELLRVALDPACEHANAFWSQIGHIGVEVPR